MAEYKTKTRRGGGSCWKAGVCHELYIWRNVIHFRWMSVRLVPVFPTSAVTNYASGQTNQSRWDHLVIGYTIVLEDKVTYGDDFALNI